MSERFKKVDCNRLGKKLEVGEEIEVKWPDKTTTQHSIDSVFGQAWITINHHEHIFVISLDGLQVRRC